MRLIVGLLACLLTAQASAVTIEWVPVGDPGNSPDTANNCATGVYSGLLSCGSVSYEYLISKYEVTNTRGTRLLLPHARVSSRA